MSPLHLALDIGGTKVVVLAIAAGHRQTWSFATGPNADPALIRSRVDSILAERGEPRAKVIGVAVPGMVDSDGVVRDCDVLPELTGWRPQDDWPAAAVLNDGEAALENVAAGEPKDATVAAIGCGTGIAAALQVAGSRLRKFRPYAGELGMVPCGVNGTFDQRASGAAILQKLGIGAAEIHARLQQNDKHCQAVIRSAGKAFGISLVTVLHLIHPSKIGLYGGTLRYPGYAPAALEAVERYAHPLLRSQCRIEVMEEPELAVATGALRAALLGRR